VRPMKEGPIPAGTDPPTNGACPSGRSFNVATNRRNFHRLEMAPSRASFYIDGFNLYHALDGLGDNSLKWLNLKSLCQSFLRDDNKLERVVFFTALNTWDKSKRERHVDYINALETVGVEVIKGTFDKPKRFCNHRELWCRNYGEKKTDVGIAVNLLGDGYENKYDVAFLMSADSDHVPLPERFNSALGSKKHLFLIAPPGRLRQARELAQTIRAKPLQLTAGRVREHLFSSEIRNSKGDLIVARPTLYGAHAKGRAAE
jgi:uncharacterized LabA/DUF88 family protein